MLYRTTPLFLKLFGLSGLDALPDVAAWDPTPEEEADLRERLLKAGAARNPDTPRPRPAGPRRSPGLQRPRGKCRVRTRGGLRSTTMSPIYAGHSRAARPPSVVPARPGR